MPIIHRSQKGDTIVEVLIAITVVSAMLGIAFVTMNRASNNARQAQERGVATKLIESQLERLKVSASTAGTTIFTRTNAFCLMNTTSEQANNFGGFGVPADADADTLSSANYHPNCTLADDGTPYSSASASSNPYYVTITRNVATNADFTVYCRWPSVTGKGNKQASISYRVHP